MAFQKIGTIYKIANTKTINIDEWSKFKKDAGIETAVVEEEKKADKKESSFDVVSEVDPEKFVYIHTTIMAGVTPEANGFNITADTEKYINDNHDSWACSDLLKDYPSFRKATTFVEHDQNIERARGKCIDAIARKLPDTVLVDVLFSVDKRHKDLVANIESGIINAVSMGCTTEKTVCSICGKEAADSKDYCQHIRNGKGQMFKCEDGKTRRAAELCKNNTFFDVSLVANPAFAGAIFRKILTANQVSNHLLSNLLCNKIESYEKGELLLKAASKEDGVRIEVKRDGTVEGEGINKATLITSEEIKDVIASTMKEEQVATSMLSRLAKKFFSNKKEATHPIENISTNIKDFSIDTHDYTGVDEDYHTPYTSVRPEAELILAQDKKVYEKAQKRNSSRMQMFSCYNCGFEEELWDIKASCIDADKKGVIVCPKCKFITEAEVNSFINVASGSIVDKMKKEIEKEKNKLIQKAKRKGLYENWGVDEVRKLRDKYSDYQYGSPEEREAWKEISNFSEWSMNVDDNTIKSSSLRLSINYLVKRDIPVSKKEGGFWFDPTGNSAIVAGEKLSFIKAESNAYGEFQTELGETVYMPSDVKKKPS